MGRRRTAWAMVLLLSLFAAGGCGGAQRPAPGAHITVGLRSDGTGQVDFWTGAGLRSDLQLRELGGRVAAALFPGRAVKPTVVVPDTAYPFARTEIPRAYEPGPRPVVRVSGEGAGAVLTAAGYSGYTLRVRPPRVRTSMGTRSRPPGAEYSWTVVPGGPRPTVVIVLRPRLVHWAVEMALLAAAVVAAVTGFASRVPWTGSTACAAALVSSLTVLVTDRSSGDCLGVLGRLSGTPLAMVTGVPLLALPVAVLVVIRFAYLRPYAGRPR